MKNSFLRFKKNTKALVLLAALAMSHVGMAQVKIGSNPTILAANTNLDVEATNGKRVQVNKTDGTFFIQNQPSAALTDSVMMSTASTGQVKQISLARLTTAISSSSGSGRGDCFVPDVAGSYNAPMLVDAASGDSYIDLTDMPKNQCFWNWPVGYYGLRIRKVSASTDSYTMHSFCSTTPVATIPTGSTNPTYAGQYLNLVLDGLPISSGSVVAVYRFIGIPNVGWGTPILDPTSSGNGILPQKIGIICRISF